jgi:hypothetical protein
MKLAVIIKTRFTSAAAFGVTLNKIHVGQMMKLSERGKEKVSNTRELLILVRDECNP